MIRKITIGIDPLKSMHYVCGQSVIDGNYSIHSILLCEDGSVEIFVEKANEVTVWKKINTYVPFSLENNLDF